MPRYYHYPKEPGKKKNEWGEYTVKAYDDAGKHYSKKDYHTDDYEDAKATHKNYLFGKKFNMKDKEIK